jgi:uncharacterized protein (DUF58 family)
VAEARATRRLRKLAEAGATGGATLSRLAERVHLTPSGVGVVVLAVVAWLLARLIGARTMYLMAYAAVGVMAMCFVAGRRRLGIDVVRSELPSRVRAGTAVDVELSITARRRVNTVVLNEELEPALGASVHVPIAALRAGDELLHRYRLKPGLRGVYHVGPLVARWSDPFGLTTHTQTVTEREEVIVHPSTELVHDRVLTRMWEDPPIRPPVSKPWPTGFEFYGMRDYVPGDDLRRVVWNQVAKTGRMMVRESEQGITDRVVVLMNTKRRFHSPGEPSLTFETAVRVAASLGVKHLDDGFAVSLLTDEGRVASALRGARARIAYLDALAAMDMSGADASDGAREAVLSESRGGAHFVVVTPHLDEEDAGRLRLVLQRGASVVIAKIVWEESDPVSMTRAAALGCQVVQVTPGHALTGVFAPPSAVARL